MMKWFSYSISVLVCCFAGGFLIGSAVDNFINGKYYICGVDIMVAIVQVAWMFKVVNEW